MLSSTISLTDSRNAVIMSNPVKEPLGPEAILSAVPGEEEFVVVITTAELSPLETGSVVI